MSTTANVQQEEATTTDQTVGSKVTANEASRRGAQSSLHSTKHTLSGLY